MMTCKYLSNRFFRLISQFLSVIIILSAWGFPSEVYSLERVVQDFNSFVYSGENVVILADGSLEHHPNMGEKMGEKSSSKVVTYDFSPVSRQRASLSKVLRTDKRLTQDGYFGTALAFTSETSPFVLPVPTFLKERPVYSWGMTVYFYPSGLAEESILMESTRIVWDEEQGVSEPYRERWRLALVQETLVTEMENLFYLGEQKISVRLESSIPIEINRWNKLELSYNVQTGEVTQWINGRFSARAEVRENEESSREGLRENSEVAAEGSFYYFGFAPERVNNSLTSLVFNLGENFNGRIDELSFYRTPVTPRPGQSVLAERTTFFTSKWSSRVFRLKPFSRLRRVSFEGFNYDFSATDVYVCSSQDYFPARNLNKWISSSEAVKDSQASMKDSEASMSDNSVRCVKGLANQDFVKMEEGFFYQLFFVSKNRAYPYPKLTQLRLVYDIDEPPLTPILTAQKSFSNAVLLQFRAGLEEDILGYKLTYRSEQDTRAQTIRIPLAELKALKRNPHEYTYYLEGLRSGLLYTLELRAYDKIIDDKERVSLGAARAVILTTIDLDAF